MATTVNQHQPDLAEDLSAVVANRLAAGQLTAAQLYVAIRGESVVDLALSAPEHPVHVDVDTTCRWLCAGKPIVAMAAGELQRQGTWDLDDPVRRWLPAFDVPDKHDVTLRHLLHHTSGLPKTSARQIFQRSFGRLIADAAAAPLGHPVPGTQVGYVTVYGWHALGAAIETATRADLRDVVADLVTEPCGLDAWLSPMSTSITVRDHGIDPPTLRHQSGKLLPGLSLMAPRALGTLDPSSGMFGSARMLGHFYARALHALSLRSSDGLDETFARMIRDRRGRRLDVHNPWGRKLDFGLGFQVGMEDHLGFEPDSAPSRLSPDSFGHVGDDGGGFRIVGFADPVPGVVLAMYVNGARQSGGAQLMRDLLFEVLDLVTASSDGLQGAAIPKAMP
jgi:CubicO group peptidase (beta-lactamase class C family)